MAKKLTQQERDIRRAALKRIAKSGKKGSDLSVDDQDRLNSFSWELRENRKMDIEDAIKERKKKEKKLKK